MEKIRIRCNEDGMKSFRDDRRVERIVNLLLDLLLHESDSRLFSKISRVISTTYTSEELVHSAGIIFSDQDVLKLGECWQPLCSIYSNKYRNNLRGAILEKLIYKLLKMKYGKSCDSGMGCIVVIGPFISSRTVDAIFSPSTGGKGENYECKVNPDGFDKEDINNLREIYFKSDKRIYPKIASFSHVKAIELRLKQLCTTATVDSLEMFGYENMKDVLR